ncbi:MAG TPA: DMT family transporter [Acidimicrobiales bacterium]|nr:DMT family transporter [Acidimicrobiales bacterium]
MVYLLAAGAAACSAIAGVLQRMGVESAPQSHAMRMSLLTHALRRGVWVLGLALLLVTFGLQATALRFGTLTVVQPILTVEILFLIAILAVVFHRQVGWREVVGSVAIVAGLTGFIASAAPATGRGIPGSHAWGLVTVLVVTTAGLLVVGAHHGPRWWRAAAFGAAAGTLFAYNASLTKATTTLITAGWAHVFGHWEPYAIGVTGATGFFLLQNALHAGPIAASRASMIMVNPTVSVAIGAFVFGEHLRSGPGFIAAEALALCVMLAGAYALTQSPLVAGSAVEGEQGEMLRRSAGPTSPAPHA